MYILLPYYRRGNLQDMINANLVHHTKFPEKRLMVLILGVCKALKAMHQYKVKGQQNGAGGADKAKKVRGQAAKADAEAAAAARRGGDDSDDEVENQPLMDDEVTQSQEGVQVGQIRAYAHRDIKPGMHKRRLLAHTRRLTKVCRQRDDR